MYRATFICLLFFIYCKNVNAQLKYKLTYTDSASSLINLEIQLPKPALSQTISFVMPRCVPGSYNIILYDRFVRNITATGSNGHQVEMKKSELDAPRWNIPDSNISISSIRYSVDLAAMEHAINALSDFSVVRKNYAGILNYSVFGWIDGTEAQSVTCNVQTFNNWPVYSTLSPTENPGKGSFTFNAANYYELADGQTVLGNFKVKKFQGLVPVYVVDYSETTQAFMDDMGWFGTNSVAVLNDYFGEIPFQHYTIFTQQVIPVDEKHTGGFAMEHLGSTTFFSDTAHVITQPWPAEARFRRSFPVLHHMCHAWLPLRCYGDRYVPHVTELPVIMNTVWFNEGFAWYLCMDTLKSKFIRNLLHASVYETDDVIKKLSLTELSQIASVLYADDFRLGRASFGRGALMADEMNDHIRKQTQNKKSMRDVFRYLYAWSQKNNRPFTMNEFPQLLHAACGVDVSTIYNKWLKPVTK